MSVTNVQSAYATILSTEKILRKDKLYAETYQKQIDDMLDIKVARQMTEQELKRYPGPKFYIVHHDVLSPQSTSNPIRVVFNSSAKTKVGEFC